MFRQYLKNKYSDIVILTNPFETYEPIEINRPVKVMCDHGAYMKYLTYHSAEDSYETNRDIDTASEGKHAAVYFNSSGIVFDKFRLLGGGKSLTTYEESDEPWLIDGLQSGIKMQQGIGTVKVIDSWIEGFNWGQIWNFDSESSIVSNNFLVGAWNEYYNYIDWLGGRGNASLQVLEFNFNIVSGGRHAVGASGHPNSYYAVRNTVENSIKAAFDRHSGNTPLVGGMHTVITGNIIKNPDRYAFSLNNPVAGGCIVFAANELARDYEKPIGEISKVVMLPSEMPAVNFYNCIFP